MQILFFKYVNSLLPFLFSAWGYFRPRWASWSADWQCLLGALLSGAWHTARRADALRQNHRRRRRLLQHLLQRDGRRETRSPSCVCRPGAYCRRLVNQCKVMSFPSVVVWFCGVWVFGFVGWELLDCCSWSAIVKRECLMTKSFPCNSPTNIIIVVVVNWGKML